MKKFEIEKTALNNYLTENNFKELSDGVKKFIGWYISPKSVLRVVESNSLNYVCELTKISEMHTYTNSGYLTFSFKPYGHILIHRALGIAFVDGYKPGLCIDHIDSNRKNNNLNNLRWVTYGENMKAAWKSKTRKKPNHTCYYSYKDEVLIIGRDREHPISMKLPEYIEWRKEHNLDITTYLKRKLAEYNNM